MREHMGERGLPKPKVASSNLAGSAYKTNQPKSWGRFGDVAEDNRARVGGAR